MALVFDGTVRALAERVTNLERGGAAGPVVATGSTAARGLSDRFADVLNAKDYDVKGDGSTNDVAKLNTLLAAALDGGTVYLPPGTYNLGSGASAVLINGKARLVGAGVGKTVLRYTGSGAAIQVNDGTITNREHHGWVISDLTVSGQNAGAVGLRLGQTSVSPKSAGGLVERARFTGFTTAGAQMVSAQLSVFVDVWFDTNPGDGFQSLGTSSENDLLTFYGCRFRSNTGRGIYLTQYDTFTFDGNSIELNQAEGLYVNKPDVVNTSTINLILRGNWIENNNQGIDPSLHPAQVRFVAAGTQTIDNVVMDANRFNGRGAGNGERHIYFTRGNYELRDNWFAFPQTQCLESLDSSLVFIHGRSSRYQYGPNNFFQFVPAPRFTNIFWEHDGAEKAGDAYPFSRRWYVNSAIAANALVPVLEMVGGDANEDPSVRAPKIGFYGATPIKKPTVTGSRGGNAALADLLSQLAALGLIVDGTSS